MHEHDVAVRPGRAAVRDLHRRPDEFAGDAVHLADHRAVHLVVVVRLVIDLDDRVGVPHRVEVLQGVAGGVTGVVPALEGGHDDGVLEFGQDGIPAVTKSHELTTSA